MDEHATLNVLKRQQSVIDGTSCHPLTLPTLNDLLQQPFTLNTIPYLLHLLFHHLVLSLFLMKAHQVANHKWKLNCCTHNLPILPPWLGRCMWAMRIREPWSRPRWMLVLKKRQLDLIISKWLGFMGVPTNVEFKGKV